MSGVLVIKNLDYGDDTFDSDIGSWNVTRAARDCAAGKHKAWEFDVAEVLEASKAIDVNERKVARMAANVKRFKKAPPPIMVVENNRVWLIDGHHRLRALARLKLSPTFLAYVIEEADAEPYRVYFNGERVSPWMKSKAAPT